MTQNQGRPSGAITIYCTRCGRAMSVAAEHVYMRVACPHCGEHLEPWRVLGVAAEESAPPTQPRQSAYPTQAFGSAGYVSSRSKTVAGLLGIFLGLFGVHRFYLGFIGIGLLQIFLTFITGGIAGLWGFTEGILCLTGQIHDVDGLPLRD
jgi:TM2 domain-containing membrane protein YozV/phage FluMu protein Com